LDCVPAPSKAINEFIPVATLAKLFNVTMLLNVAAFVAEYTNEEVALDAKLVDVTLLENIAAPA
jgi:hypothetical protein